MRPPLYLRAINANVIIVVQMITVIAIEVMLSPPFNIRVSISGALALAA